MFFKHPNLSCKLTPPSHHHQKAWNYLSQIPNARALPNITKALFKLEKLNSSFTVQTKNFTQLHLNWRHNYGLFNSNKKQTNFVRSHNYTPGIHGPFKPINHLIRKVGQTMGKDLNPVLSTPYPAPTPLAYTTQTHPLHPRGQLILT